MFENCHIVWLPKQLTAKLETVSPASTSSSVIKRGVVASFQTTPKRRKNDFLNEKQKNLFVDRSF